MSRSKEEAIAEVTTLIAMGQKETASKRLIEIPGELELNNEERAELAEDILKLAYRHNINL